MKQVCIVLLLLGLLAGCDRDGGATHMAAGSVSHSMQVIGTANAALPDTSSSAGQLTVRFCGQCHGPPNPSVHTADEWPAVIARMKQHMTTAGARIPDEEQTQIIIEYMRSHTR